MSEASAKPSALSLKQRTSSKALGGDYSNGTWLSLLELMEPPLEFLCSIDNFSIWRRHVAWATDDGGRLKSYITSRFSSGMIFMSLLLGAELNVLFNSAKVTTEMRQRLYAEDFLTVEFWAGMTILVSVIVTILGLMSTFTAWGLVSAVSDENAHCILRSSIGQYVAELPGRFTVTAFYSFLLWFILFFFLLLPLGFWSILLVLVTIGLFVHVVVVFSGFGRIIMHTSAMKNERIFEKQFEKTLWPVKLHDNLLRKAKESLKKEVSITRQYDRPSHPLDHTFTAADLESTRSVAAYSPAFTNDVETPHGNRTRVDSAVRFADTLWTTISQPEVTPSLRDKGTLDKPPAESASALRTPTSHSAPFLPKPTPLQNLPATSFVTQTSMDSTASLDAWLQAGSNSDSSPRATPSNVPPNGVEKPPRIQKDPDSPALNNHSRRTNSGQTNTAYLSMAPSFESDRPLDDEENEKAVQELRDICSREGTSEQWRLLGDNHSENTDYNSLDIGSTKEQNGAK